MFHFNKNLKKNNLKKNNNKNSLDIMLGGPQNGNEELESKSRRNSKRLSVSSPAMINHHNDAITSLIDNMSVFDDNMSGDSHSSSYHDGSVDSISSSNHEDLVHHKQQVDEVNEPTFDPSTQRKEQEGEGGVMTTTSIPNSSSLIPNCPPPTPEIGSNRPDAIRPMSSDMQQGRVRSPISRLQHLTNDFTATTTPPFSSSTNRHDLVDTPIINQNQNHQKNNNTQTTSTTKKQYHMSRLGTNPNQKKTKKERQEEAAAAAAALKDKNRTTTLKTSKQQQMNMSSSSKNIPRPNRASELRTATNLSNEIRGFEASQNKEFGNICGPKNVLV